MKRRPTYTLMSELMASPTAPMPAAKARHQLTRMYEGLDALERAAQPTKDDWRVCSDCVNLMETLITMGEMQDDTGLLMDAITALATAGRRNVEGKPLRLSGEGMQAVRAVLEDYAEALKVLPERTVIRCHRLTEKRLTEILAGKRLPHDVEVIA